MCGGAGARAGQHRPGERGFVLLAMGACMFLLLAVIAMAFDLGRIYIVRNEAQVFADAAAMAAARELDGTAAGLDRARAAVSKLPNRWNLGTQEFRNVEIEFSADGNRWEKEPMDPAALQYARVTAAENRMQTTFLRAAGGPADFNVPARAVAARDPVRLTD
jgi:hypothetical protein